MTPEQKIEGLERRINKLESILFSSNNDVRFQTKIRSIIFAGEHASGKPIAVNKEGKRYNLQTA